MLQGMSGNWSLLLVKVLDFSWPIKSHILQYKVFLIVPHVVHLVNGKSSDDKNSTSGQQSFHLVCVWVQDGSAHISVSLVQHRIRESLH